MGENKGKPAGKVADSKKDPGKQGDEKELGEVAGAKKKDLGKQPVAAGGHSHKHYETRN